MFLFVFLFFSSSKTCGNILQASRPNGETIRWNFAEDNLVCFSSPRCPAFVFVSPHFWQLFLLFLYCGIAKEETDLPVEFCHPRPVALLWFLCLIHRIIFLFPLCQVPVQSGLPIVSLLTHFDTKPLLVVSWRGAECKPEHMRSQEGNREHQSAIWPLHFFFSPKRSTLALGLPGLREQKTRDVSCTVFSEDDFCSRCLVKALPLTTLLSNHTTVSSDSHAVLLLSALWWWAATWHL